MKFSRGGTLPSPPTLSPNQSSFATSCWFVLFLNFHSLLPFLFTFSATGKHNDLLPLFSCGVVLGCEVWCFGSPGGIAETALCSLLPLLFSLCACSRLTSDDAGGFPSLLRLLNTTPGLFLLSFWPCSLFCASHAWFGFLADPQGESLSKVDACE